MSRDGRQSRAGRQALGFTMFGIAALVLGCSGSQLVDMWADPQPPAAPLANLLVVAMKKDPARRRLWEDGFAAEIAKHNARVTPSYRLFATAVPDTQQVISAVREHGFDGVLVAHRLGTETQTRQVAGYTTQEPVTRRNPWTGNYYTYWREIHHPGYTETERIVIHQVDVWSTKDGGRLVWTGNARTLDPNSSEVVSKEITSLVIPELMKKGLLATGK